MVPRKNSPSVKLTKTEGGMGYAASSCRKKLQRNCVYSTCLWISSVDATLHHCFKWQMEFVIIIMIRVKEIKAGNGTYRLTDLLSCAFVGGRKRLCRYLCVWRKLRVKMKLGIATNKHWQMSLFLVNLSAKGHGIGQYLLCGVLNNAWLL